MAQLARQLYFEAVKVGDELPPLVKPPIDRIQMARFAGASGDFNPLHVDEHVAKNAGFPSVHVPAMLGMGFVGELLVDWLRGARIRRFSARFPKLVWPGDVLTCRGRVAERRFEEGGSYAIDLELWAENQRGELVLKGSASAQLYYSGEDDARQRAGGNPLIVTPEEEAARLAKLSRAQPPKRPEVRPPPPPPAPEPPAPLPAASAPSRPVPGRARPVLAAADPAPMVRDVQPVREGAATGYSPRTRPEAGTGARPRAPTTRRPPDPAQTAPARERSTGAAGGAALPPAHFPRGRAPPLLQAGGGHVEAHRARQPPADRLEAHRPEAPLRAPTIATEGQGSPPHGSGLGAGPSGPAARGPARHPSGGRLLDRTHRLSRPGGRRLLAVNARAALFALSLLLAAPAARGEVEPPRDAAASHPGEAYAAALASADAAYAERLDLARLKAAIAGFEEAAALRPDEPAPLVRLARAHAFRAELAPAEAREAWGAAGRAAEGALRLLAPSFEEALRRGEAPGEAAKAVGVNGAEPLYLLGEAGMGLARQRGMAAILAVKDGALALVERAASLDERVDRAGPRRVLGAWRATLPTAAGGGVAASRRELERARQLFPDELLTDVEEARTLAVLLQDEKRFESLLVRVLASEKKASSKERPDDELARRRARELLARRESALLTRLSCPGSLTGSSERRHRMTRALRPMLALLALSVACAHAPPAGLSRAPEKLLAQVRASQERVQRVRGTARVRIQSPDLSGTVLEAIAAEKPDSVRLETLDFFGNPAAVLVASRGRFAFYDAKENVLYRGEASPENVSRLLPVVLPVEELVTILCGSAPLLAGRPREVKAQGSQLLLTLARGELGQRLAVGEEATVESSRLRRAGASAESAAYDLDLDDFAGRGGVRFPRSVHLDAPRGRARVDLAWKADLEVNGEIDPRLFELPSPRGARLVQLERGEVVPLGSVPPPAGE